MVIPTGKHSCLRLDLYKDTIDFTFIKSGSPYPLLILTKDGLTSRPIQSLRIAYKHIRYFPSLMSINREITKVKSTINDIVDDPMCGCTEDFIKDYDKILTRLICKREKILFVPHTISF